MATIVIEGTEGAGKSSVASELKSRLGAEIVSTSHLNFLPAIRQFLNVDPTQNILARFIYYISTNKFSACAIPETGHKLRVIDRYIYSTTAAHLAIDDLYNGGKLKEALYGFFDKESENMMVPDAVVFLYVDSEHRKQRIDGSSTLHRDKDKLDTDDAFAMKSQDFFKEIATKLKTKNKPKIIEVNTSQKTVADVVEEVIAKLSEISLEWVS